MYRNGKLIDRREMLVIKAKSLAAEARFIRQRELKCRPSQDQLRTELYFHRTRDVRHEARHTYLALGLIKGRTIEQMEPHRLPTTAAPDMAKINAMVKKYGPAVQKPELKVA